jgi:hypothetical protein
MRLVFSSALCALVVGGASACGPKLEITLVKSERLAADPEFVQLVFHTEDDAEGLKQGPFDIAGELPDQSTAIPAETQFFIDARVCPENDPATCDVDADLVAQGCSGFDELDADPFNLKGVTITLFPPGDLELDCPPPPPAAGNE